MTPPVPAGRTPLSRPISVFVAVFLITVIFATVVTFILPESYASTARVQVPGNIQAEFEILQSQLVLEPVIARLNLNVEWGRKYSSGEALKTSEALKLLKSRLSLEDRRGTLQIAITVYSDNPQEAAQIANAIAEAYQQYSVEKNYPAGTVQIVDQAKPGKFPVRPNKLLNIALGAIAGMVLGALAAALVGLFASRKS